MKVSTFWKPVFISLVATPICLFLGLVSTGAGHGNYLWARILFPYTMLSTLIFESITVPFMLLAIIQFPLYGIALEIARRRQRFLLMSVALLVLHSLAVVIFTLFPNKNFC
jgi:hypothetical protein